MLIPFIHRNRRALSFRGYKYFPVLQMLTNKSGNRETGLPFSISKRAGIWAKTLYAQLDASKLHQTSEIGCTLKGDSAFA
jgi:hypothetical protein